MSILGLKMKMTFVAVGDAVGVENGDFEEAEVLSQKVRDYVFLALSLALDRVILVVVVAAAAAVAIAVVVAIVDLEIVK